MYKQALFTAGEGWPCYRIPGLIVTARGTLIAYCETRTSNSDWSTNGVAYRRSLDGGESWSDMTQVVRTRAEVAANNPLMIARANGEVVLLWMTDYDRLYRQASLDDGASFSQPKDISEALDVFKAERPWTCAAVGPGHGIELPAENGGEIVVPVWMARGEGRSHHPSVASIIKSADGGRTWSRGSIIYENPEIGFLTPNETAVALLPGGALLLNIRAGAEVKRRFLAVSRDGGATFSGAVAAADLPDPHCFGAMCRAGGRVAFSNCAHESKRTNLTIYVSDAPLERWTPVKRLGGEVAGYSDLQSAPDGSFYCLYESGNVGESLWPEALVFEKVQCDV